MNIPRLKYVMIELEDGRQFIAEAPQIMAVEVMDSILPDDMRWKKTTTIRMEFEVDGILVRKENVNRISIYSGKLLEDKNGKL